MNVVLNSGIGGVIKKNKHKVVGLFLGLLSLVGAQSALASSRATKKVGLAMGILSDPLPSLKSYQLKYNLTERFQLLGSYGSIGATVTSYGLSAKLFLIPSWNLSPYVGGGISKADINDDFTIGGGTVDSANSSLNVYYASFGVDHQSNIGFNFGAGYSYILAPSKIANEISLIPQFYFGWVF